jgi:exopolysaccharide biosynthesis polyprenyl glycosylphosphotransferase
LAINLHRKNAALFCAADIVSIGLAFNLVLYLRAGMSPVIMPLLVPAMVFVLALHLIDGYGARTDMMSLDYASEHLIASFSAAIAMLLMTFVIIPAGFELQSSRASILLAFGLAGPLSLAYRRFASAKVMGQRGRRTIVFVGSMVDFELFSAECARMNATMPLVHANSTGKYEMLEGALQAIESSQLEAEAIVIRESRNELPVDVPMRLVQLYLQGVPTYTLEIFHQVYWKKIPLYRINPIWLFQEGFEIAREPVFERIKRLSDIVLSLVGLVLFSPLIAAAAVAIKLDDQGPVFFHQTRIGWHKVPFKLIKLRTMRISEKTGDRYTQKGDARITRVGAFLRKTRLDELPQLWNVMRGQMSLIGPRAEWDLLVEGYAREIPCYHFRHLVKPGITGWAQVNYRYGAGVEDTLRKLEYDLYYIRNFSFLLDASIVLKTIHVMILQRGR